MNFVADILDAMSANQMPHVGNINLYTGVYHAFTSSSGNCKNNCCRYRIFELQLGAHLICWKRNIDVFWFAKDRKTLTLKEKISFHNENEKVTKFRNDAYAKAAKRCVAFLTRATNLPNNSFLHPYTIRKKISPYMAITVRQMLCILILNIDYEIQTLQFIKKNGFKLFKSGAKASCGMIWLCEHLAENYPGIIRICEGWATGCTIRSITNSPVICALNAGNLPKVALALRKKYYKATILICSDNDKVGLKFANEAAKINGMSVHYPIFNKSNSKHTDFNDLFILCGEKVTKSQLMLIRKSE